MIKSEYGAFLFSYHQTLETMKNGFLGSMVVYSRQSTKVHMRGKVVETIGITARLGLVIH